MNPQSELLKEITMAVSLYKEALEKLDETIMTGKTNDFIVKEVHDAREYLFSFLETPQYED